ncbi:hypothetical protein [Agrobacterium larrymoorei]|uniref:Uncharacterized protein n=1 Tax=Agrobacterium larrymoorei TaxID=160699 RepID=A0AAF0KF34_9HYPH|nr:hypothetical protein [Agrobacterium larrymoorei]WHA42626.1 hypothetical protein CFBP5477_015200 [Agrobacterium larrymoorei]
MRLLWWRLFDDFQRHACCTNARTKGTCENRLNIRRNTLEASILNGLDKHLMESPLFRNFCEEFTRELNKARIAACASIEAAEIEIRKIDRELDKLLDLILKGSAADRINIRMVTLEQRKKDLATMLETAEAPLPFSIPTWPKSITKKSPRFTSSFTMRISERRRQNDCADWSAASISCRIRRNL